MSTLSELVATEKLFQIELPLEPDTLPWRLLYGTPAFIEWLDKTLPSMESSTIGYEFTPEMQVFDRFSQFVAGESMRSDRRFKSLSCTPQHYIWELKTNDVRVFGWIPRKNSFVCTFGDHADTVKVKDLYGRYIALSAYARNQLQLDEPKAIESREYDDVLSDAP